MYIDLGIVFLCAIALVLWAIVMWSIGFKQGREEGYSAGYMKGRLVGRAQVSAE